MVCCYQISLCLHKGNYLKLNRSCSQIYICHVFLIKPLIQRSNILPPVKQ